MVACRRRCMAASSRLRLRGQSLGLTFRPGDSVRTLQCLKAAALLLLLAAQLGGLFTREGQLDGAVAG